MANACVGPALRDCAKTRCVCAFGFSVPVRRFGRSSRDTTFPGREKFRPRGPRKVFSSSVFVCVRARSLCLALWPMQWKIEPAEFGSNAKSLRRGIIERNARSFEIGWREFEGEFCMRNGFRCRLRCFGDLTRRGFAYTFPSERSIGKCFFFVNLI